MYSQKAFDILKSSINSAIFIDEKAKDFYSGTPINTDIVEENLSLKLFETFKENGKNLIVHKFEKSNLKDTNLMNYLFSEKDLILLDWELDDVNGQEYSLELLATSIEKPQINFCCIYSRSTNFNDIPTYLTAYFSGLTQENFESIRDHFSNLTLEEINKYSSNPNNDLEKFFEDYGIVLQDFPLPEFRNKPQNVIFDLLTVAFQNEKYFYQSELKHEIIYSSEDSFIINNTFVLTIKKEDQDSNFDYLIRRISDEIIKNKSSFFQLLGLEMKSVFNSNEKFIDETILKSSTEALFQYRNHLKDDKTFGIIIKKLLIEQATLKLRTAKLSLLDTDFLDFKSKELENTVPSIEDLFQLNVFYNSVSVKSLHPENIPNLNFGDIFKDSEDNYYLCITALCDCFEPKKIDFNFYFVTGKEFTNIELALKLGDSAFISYLPNGKAIDWGNLDGNKGKEVKEPSLSNSEDDVKKLKNDVKTLQQIISKLSTKQTELSGLQYIPFYIKPKIFNVEDNKIVDKKLRIWDITNKFKKEKFDQDLNYFDIEYLTTLRNDYTQRIANHAFGHPARVGVDFVKIK